MSLVTSIRRVQGAVSIAMLFVMGLGVTPVGEAAPAAPVMAQTTVPNLAKAVLSSGWMSSCNRYERMQGMIVLSGSKGQVKVYTCNFTTGGTYIPIGADLTLTLTFDGTPVASTA